MFNFKEKFILPGLTSTLLKQTSKMLKSQIATHGSFVKIMNIFF